MSIKFTAGSASCPLQFFAIIAIETSIIISILFTRVILLIVLWIFLKIIF